MADVWPSRNAKSWPRVQSLIHSRLSQIKSIPANLLYQSYNHLITNCLPSISAYDDEHIVKYTFKCIYAENSEEIRNNIFTLCQRIDRFVNICQDHNIHALFNEYLLHIKLDEEESLALRLYLKNISTNDHNNAPLSKLPESVISAKSRVEREAHYIISWDLQIVMTILYFLVKNTIVSFTSFDSIDLIQAFSHYEDDQSLAAWEYIMTQF